MFNSNFWSILLYTKNKFQQDNSLKVARQQLVCDNSVGLQYSLKWLTRPQYKEKQYKLKGLPRPFSE